MEYYFILITIISVIALTNASFINPYPRYKQFHDGGDTGEPLYLTPLIKAGNLTLARNLSLVSTDNNELNWAESYSGYLTVDKQFNSNMFFWYFPAEINPGRAPVVLWLQGGPGASSLFGLFTENGPYQVLKNKKLSKRKYSWNHNHNLIYIDNPVGTGFSFTDSEKGYAINEKDVGRNLYEAMVQFFTLFPDLQPLDFWVTGESYGGKYVPALAYKIHEMQLHQKQNVHINLKGVAIGNGLSDPLHQLKYGDYLYQLGLVDINALQQFHKKEAEGAKCIKERNMTCAFTVFDELVNMDESPSGSLFHNLTGFKQYFNYLKTNSDDSDKNLGDFIQTSSTRKAIHVGNNSFHDLEGENKVEEFLKNDVMDSVAPWIAELLNSAYRICIYNGQLDVIVAYPLTLNYLQKLKFNDAALYASAPRYIWRVDGEIAGYAKEAGNLVEVLIRNAGHMAPADQPKWAFDLITRLTNKKGFA